MMAKRSRQTYAAADPEPFGDDTAKMQLALRVIEAIKTSGLTQTSIAAILKTDQPKVSKLMRLQVAEFSTLRLMRFLTLMGRDIEISVDCSAKFKAGLAGKLSIAGKTDARRQ